jgi:hypothetical protein
MAVSGGNSSVQGCGQLQPNQWPLFSSPGPKIGNQVQAGLFFFTDNDLYAMALQPICTATGHIRIWIQGPDDNPRNTGLKYGLGAGRRSTLMVARL